MTGIESVTSPKAAVVKLSTLRNAFTSICSPR